MSGREARTLRLMIAPFAIAVLAVGCADSKKKTDSSSGTPSTQFFTPTDSGTNTFTPPPSGPIDNDLFGDDTIGGGTTIPDPIPGDTGDGGSVGGDSAADEALLAKMSEIDERMKRNEEYALKGFQELKKNTEDSTGDKIAKWGTFGMVAYLAGTKLFEGVEAALVTNDPAALLKNPNRVYSELAQKNINNTTQSTAKQTDANAQARHEESMNAIAVLDRKLTGVDRSADALLQAVGDLSSIVASNSATCGSIQSSLNSHMGKLQADTDALKKAVKIEIEMLDDMRTRIKNGQQTGAQPPRTNSDRILDTAREQKASVEAALQSLQSGLASVKDDKIKQQLNEQIGTIREKIGEMNGRLEAIRRTH